MQVHSAQRFGLLSSGLHLDDADETATTAARVLDSVIVLSVTGTDKVR